MRLEEHDNSDGKRVRLTKDELTALFDAYSGDGDSLTDDMEKEIALRLMGQCGLRTTEMTEVSPSNLRTIETADGTHTKLQVLKGKGDKDKEDKYRETFVPEGLADLLRAFQRSTGVGETDPYVDRDRSTIHRWTNRASEHMATVTGDSDWQEVGSHDLRRSWAMALLDDDVNAITVMELGGWENYTTFREHYLSNLSDETIARQVGPVFD